MFKKFSAVAALVGLIFAGVTPAEAAPNTNSQSQTWFYNQYNTDYTNYNATTSWTFNVPAGATEVRASSEFRLGANFVAANAGKVFNFQIVLKKPNGQVFSSGSETGYLQVGSQYPSYPYTIADGDGAIQGSRGLTTSYYGALAASVPAGTWTAEVNATLDGTPIAFDATAGQEVDNAVLKAQIQYIRGKGILESLPTSLNNAEYTTATCVNPDLVAPGDTLMISSDYFAENGSVTHDVYGAQGYTLSNNDYVQSSMDSNNQQYLVWSAGFETDGVYFGRTAYSTIHTGNAPYLELSIFNQDSNTEVSMNCASTVPTIPEMSITSTWGGSISFLDEPGVYRWEYQVVDANDSSVITTQATVWKQWATLENGRYSTSVNGSFTAGHLYRVRVRSTNGVAASAWSEFSEATGLVGPAAPTGTPVLAITSATAATVTFDANPNENNSSNYKAQIFNTSDRNTVVAESSTWNCNIQGSSVTCNVSGNGFESPAQFVAVGLVKNNSGIWSNPSADSNVVTGITSGISIPTAPSGLTTDGKARSVSDDALGLLLTSNNQKISTAPDGSGALYISNRSAAGQARISKIKASATEIDTTFGDSGYVSVTFDGDQAPAYSGGQVAWFGSSASRGWAYALRGGNGYYIAQGDASSTTVAAADIGTQAFCASEMADQNAWDMSFRLYSAPTVQPVATLSCGVMSDSAVYLVKVEENGSLTKLQKITPSGSNDYYVTSIGGGMGEPAFANTVNPAATGSQTAIAIGIVNSASTYSDNAPPTNQVHSRVLWRIPANLSAPSSTPLTYSTNTNLNSMGQPTEPLLSFQPFNNGTKFYALVYTYASGCGMSNTTPPVYSCSTPSLLKLHEAAVESGNLNSTASAKTVTGATSSAMQIQALVPTADATVQTITASQMSQCGMNGCFVTGGTLRNGVINTSTGASATGESVTYTAAGSPLNIGWTNSSGKYQWLFTKPSASGHSLIEWQPAVVSAPLIPIPNIIGSELGRSLNAGNVKFEILGQNMNLVTGVRFGNISLPNSKFSKTSTKLVITVPATADTGSTDVTLLYASGQIAVGQWSYMGRVKTNQEIELSVGDLVHAGTSEPQRQIETSSNVGGEVTVLSKSPAVCRINDNLITFVGTGTCIIQASNPGNLWLSPGSVTKEIVYETPISASSLMSTDSGRPTIVIMGQGLKSVSKVIFGVNEVTPSKKSDTSLLVKVPLADPNSSVVPLQLKYTNGVVIDSGLSFTYVGPVRLQQTVTLDAGSSIATYGDSTRTLSAQSVDQNSERLENLPYTFLTKTPLICSVIGTTLRFLTSGECRVQAKQAGNAGVSAATSQESVIFVWSKEQEITVESTLSITDATGGSLEATNSNQEVALEYESDNETICSVDGEGFVTGYLEGTCVITVTAPEDARYSGDIATVTVTVTIDPTEILPDAADVLDQTPIQVNSGGVNAFISLSDPSLMVSWDKASGKLTPRATGVYTGNIVAELKFTRNGVNYVCTNVFGSTTKLSNPRKPVAPTNPGDGATAKQLAAYAKSLASYTKLLAAYKVAYNKTWGSKVFSAKNFCADTYKIRGATALNPFGANFATAVKTAKTSAENRAEANALKALKGFEGSVTITVKRWRAWPTTMKNKTGNAETGKTIPATKNINTLTLG